MNEYLDTGNAYCLVIDTHKRKKSWLEVPKGAEVLTGLKNDKYSQVFWKPSIGEVFSEGRFASYSFHNSVSFEEYVSRWKTDLILWKRA